MQITSKKTGLAALAVAALIGTTAGSCSSDSGDKTEKDFTERSQRQFNIAQPPHQYDASQARENLIAAHDAMAYGANSWTVQYTEGVGITFQCASRGFPLPFGTQLTNPDKVVGNAHGNVTVPQQEPYGVYPPADVPATLANCVLPDGNIGIFYSEPPLTAFMFDVKCDDKAKSCKVSGSAKATVTVKKVDPRNVRSRPAQGTATPTPGG